MELAHTKTTKEVVDYFGTDPERGLTESQVKKLQDKYGPNGERRRGPRRWNTASLLCSLKGRSHRNSPSSVRAVECLLNEKKKSKKCLCCTDVISAGVTY